MPERTPGPGEVAEPPLLVPGHGRGHAETVPERQVALAVEGERVGEAVGLYAQRLGRRQHRLRVEASPSGFDRRELAGVDADLPGKRRPVHPAFDAQPADPASDGRRAAQGRGR